MVDRRRATWITAGLLVLGLAAAAAAFGQVSPHAHALIAFSRCRELDSCERGSDIWVMRPDATGLKLLTQDGTHNDSPTWSPDGTHIAYVSGLAGRDAIWTMKADGTDKRQVTQSLGLDEQPAWSPDGRRIVFVHLLSNTSSELEVVNADGTGFLKRLIPAAGDYKHPSWSPNGRRIAYSYARNPKRGHYAIYVVGANGRGAKRLSRNAHADYLDPVWSPSGRQIAFSCLVPAGKSYRADLKTMNAAGGDERAVAHARAHTVYFAPSWSPDGKRIAFVTLNATKNQGEIAFVDSDGRRLQELRQLLGDNRGPSWQASPRAR